MFYSCGLTIVLVDNEIRSAVYFETTSNAVFSVIVSLHALIKSRESTLFVLQRVHSQVYHIR